MRAWSVWRIMPDGGESVDRIEQVALLRAAMRDAAGRRELRRLIFEFLPMPAAAVLSRAVRDGTGGEEAADAIEGEVAEALAAGQADEDGILESMELAVMARGAAGW